MTCIVIFHACLQLIVAAANELTGTSIAILKVRDPWLRQDIALNALDMPWVTF